VFSISLLLLIPIVLWSIIMTIILLPTNFVRNRWELYTKGQRRVDATNLNLILDYLRNQPDEWSISDTTAHFPAKGAKKIALEYDEGEWKYYIDGFDSRYASAGPHFSQEISSFVGAEMAARKTRSLLRSFYPDLDVRLLT